MDLGEELSHVVGRGELSKPPLQLPCHLQPVSGGSEQPNVTATRKTAKPKKPTPKPAAATKAASVKPSKKAPTSVKTNELVVTPQPPVSALKDLISTT
jgi:hypothetical protein